MRLALILSCSLAAAAAPAWANAPGAAPAAVRCAAVGERVPMMMELGVAMTRAASKQVPAAAAQLPELERSLLEARPALQRFVAQTRAEALKAMGGDEAALERELAKLRPQYAGLDAADPAKPDAALLLLLDRVKSDMETACQPGGPNKAS